ncbi:hypothetical protein [Niabella hibiscisoli]|uniref:hypothetical protein n=1 Tax=Niabella hibiscisoli TaxID=1825928 RepID=UPI001F105F8D|nr:hypothetical protein [Niabella hibiscisoli]MCH5716524.1 hypothetical protein [Niabella hibiscisoli]
MKTQYDNFLDDVNQLESITSITEYKNRINHYVAKYKGIVLPTDTSYEINSSGSLEACLINKDGIVKVENDVIYFGANQAVTFLNKRPNEVLDILKSKKHFSSDNSLLINSDPTLHKYSIPANVGKTTARNISSTAMGPGLRWSLRNQLWNQGNETSGIPHPSDGRGYARLRLFNVSTISNGVRGFITVEANFQSRNLLGTWIKRGVEAVVLFGQLDIVFMPMGTHNLVNGPLYPKGAIGSNVYDYQGVVLGSDYLVSNPSELNNIPGIPYNNQSYLGQAQVLNDNVLNNYTGWWGYALTNNAYSSLITQPLSIDITSTNGPAPHNGGEATFSLTNGDAM